MQHISLTHAAYLRHKSTVSETVSETDMIHCASKSLAVIVHPEPHSNPHLGTGVCASVVLFASTYITLAPSAGEEMSGQRPPHSFICSTSAIGRRPARSSQAQNRRRARSEGRPLGRRVAIVVAGAVDGPVHGAALVARVLAPRAKKRGWLLFLYSDLTHKLPSLIP